MSALRTALHTLRDLLSSVAPFVLLTLLLLALAYWWLDPMPPKRITLATGPAQSAYDELGKRYAQILKGYGIEVRLNPSQGAAHNLQLLRDGQVDIAFVQGGTGVPTEDEELESLGSLFVEPVWLFYRTESARRVRPQGTLTSLSELKGLRLNVGAEGSGVPSLMQRLFEANRINPAGMKLSQLDQTPAVMDLLAGKIDALVLASAPESLMVQMLLQTPGVRLMDFSQSEAYARRFSFLTPVTLPRGVVDLARDIPAQDVRLIATTTTLLATPDVHPALLQLFSQASLRLHGPAGWFNRTREFPNAGQTEFPLAQEAERTLKSGVPLLQRYLSFTLANLLERMWLALGIIIAILLPLSRIVPPLYTFRIRSRVFRWYAQLKQIEDRIQAGEDSREELLQDLQQLDARAAKVKVPLSYAEELYALRQHISMVRGRLPQN